MRREKKYISEAAKEERGISLMKKKQVLRLFNVTAIMRVDVLDTERVRSGSRE